MNRDPFFYEFWLTGWWMRKRDETKRRLKIASWNLKRKQFEPHGQPTSPHWWERFAVIVSMVATVLTLGQTVLLMKQTDKMVEQTDLMREQLTTADRNRSLQTGIEDLQRVCALYDRYPINHREENGVYLITDQGPKISEVDKRMIAEEADSLTEKAYWSLSAATLWLRDSERDEWNNLAKFLQALSERDKFVPDPAMNFQFIHELKVRQLQCRQLRNSFVNWFRYGKGLDLEYPTVDFSTEEIQKEDAVFD